jgi:hypothetical protein
MFRKIFGSNKREARPYVDHGVELTHLLVYSLELPGWENRRPVYTAKESGAVNHKLSQLQGVVNKGLDDVQFRPDMGVEANELVLKMQREALADALEQLAESARRNEPSDAWKLVASTYLKAWAAKLNPEMLIELGSLLVREGRIAEARKAFEVALLFPTYAQTYWKGLDATEMVDSIVKSAREGIEYCQNPTEQS